MSPYLPGEDVIIRFEGIDMPGEVISHRLGDGQMKFKYQTWPPECHCCGVMDHDGCDVECFSDLDEDPQWGNWLCPRCRESQQGGKTPKECCK